MENKNKIYHAVEKTPNFNKENRRFCKGQNID